MKGRSRRLSTCARTTRAMVSQETDPKDTIMAANRKAGIDEGHRSESHPTHRVSKRVRVNITQTTVGKA